MADVALGLGERIPILSREDVIKVIRIASRNREVFVNRNEEIALLAAINTENYLNFKMAKSRETKAMCIPVSMHTFGAGKTALSEVYRSRLLAQGSQVNERLRNTYTGAELQEAELSIQQMAESGRDVRVNASETMKETVLRIMTELIRLELVPVHLVQILTCYRQTSQNYVILLEEFLTAARLISPLFLSVDEIGVMTYDEFRNLRNHLAEIEIITTGEKAFPLHLYLCGRVSYKDALLAGGMGGSGSHHQLIVLNGLLPEHVAQIRAELEINVTRENADQQAVETAFDTEVARLTAGIGRHIRRLLAMVSLREYRYHTAREAIEGVRAISLRMATTVALVDDYERLGEASALELACMVAAQCLDKVFEETDPALDCDRYLPVTRQRCEGGVTVVCAPIFAWGLADRLDQIALSLITGAAQVFSTQGLSLSEAREMHVIHALQRRLIRPFLLRQLEGGCLSDPITIKLSTLLEFLPGDIPDQDVTVRFKNEVVRRRFTTKWTPEQKFELVDETFPLCISQPLEKSMSADIFLHTGSTNIAMVEFQVKQGAQEINFKTIHLDCIKKVSKPPSGRGSRKVLHILLADNLHTDVLEVFLPGEDVHVLKPRSTFMYLKHEKNEDEEEVGKKRVTTSVPVQVPDFLTILLVKPSVFQRFAPVM